MDVRLGRLRTKKEQSFKIMNRLRIYRKNISILMRKMTGWSLSVVLLIRVYQLTSAEKKWLFLCRKRKAERSFARRRYFRRQWRQSTETMEAVERMETEYRSTKYCILYSCFLNNNRSQIANKTKYDVRVIRKTLPYLIVQCFTPIHVVFKSI